MPSPTSNSSIEVHRDPQTSLGWRVLRSIYWRSQPSAEQIHRSFQHLRARVSASIKGCRLVLPASAVVTVPLRCEGAGGVAIGPDVHLGYARSFRCGTGEILFSTRSKGASISVGCGTWINNNCSITAKQSVEIGSRCLIGVLVMISDFEAHAFDPVDRHARDGEAQPVRIGENVWIGNRVTILKGVTIGDNAVVGAGAVVTKSVPNNMIVGGVPARAIRELGASCEQIGW